MSSTKPILAPKQGSAHQFILTTLPLLGVLIYFLIEASRRPNLPIYNLPENYTQEEWEAAVEESGLIVSLMDMLNVFLVLHIFWTVFAVYTISFISKRRHLIGRYLAEGELCLGDVIYDKGSRVCGSFHDYGYAVYAHPTQRKLVRKRVRVYQQYTRERVAILRLPNRPLSGQCKIDLEIDLSAATKERDGSLKYIIAWSSLWVLLTLFGPIYILHQIKVVNQLFDENFSLAFKKFLIVVGLNPPFAFGVNWLRFLMYRNWMINRGAIIEDEGDARKISHCIKMAQSEDGSDVIPYSILNEEEMSYQGTIPSHIGASNSSLMEPTKAPPTPQWVTL